MYYENVETYLNEEYIKPIMFFAENGQLNQLYDWTCALAQKYIEMNAYALAYEKILKDKNINIDFPEFMKVKNQLTKPSVDFSKLESPFTNEEQQSQLDMLSELITDVVNNYIGDRIRTLRKREHISQQVLADRTGLSKTAINNIETGKSVPSLTTFNKILGALGYASYYRKLAKQ